MRTWVVRGIRSSLYWPLLLPAALLLGFGLLVLAGVEVRLAARWQDNLHLTQMAGIAVGLAAALMLLLVPYKELVQRAYLLYGFNVILLLLVLGVGPIRNYTRRWLSLFGFDFQPSELMKLTLVITLARYIRFRSSHKTFKGLATPFLLTLLPVGLILFQPDLGTALLFIPILFVMLFVAGARPRHLLLVLLLGACGIFPVYEWGLSDYQRRRIDGFLVQLSLMRSDAIDNEAREMQQEENYQVQKSKVAIGAGGWSGAAADGGGEHALFHVPERHNDFIFATLGNEWGLLGGLALLALNAWLLLAILGVALRQRDPAGRLICIGVFALFGFQAFINIAMTVGLLPVTGLTLPFLSAGRSSIVVSILAVALVCNVAGRPSYEFGRGDFD